GYAAASAIAEETARAFAFETRDAVVTILRLPAVSGPSVPAAPVVPATPRGQALHEDDAALAVVHALTNTLPGTFNVASDEPAVPGAISGERFRATGFEPSHTSAEAVRL